MRKKRLRDGADRPGPPVGPAAGDGDRHGAGGGDDAGPGREGGGPGPGRDGGAGARRRPARVRDRLVVAVAVVAVAVLGAGTPAVVSAVRDVHDSQRLADLAGLNARAVALAHALADERDAVTPYVAGGREDRGTVPGALRTGVDRRIAELHAEARDAFGTDPAYADAVKLLAELPATRRAALSGTGPATDTFAAYGHAIAALHGIGRDLASGVPARAPGSGADIRALPALGRATDQASATRGLLLAARAAAVRRPAGTDAPAGEDSADGLTAAAREARLRERGALADFTETASAAGRENYARTVTGTEATAAERALSRLTDGPGPDAVGTTDGAGRGDEGPAVDAGRASDEGPAVDAGRVADELAARVGLMRGAEAALATAGTERLSALRDEDVAALEMRIGLVGLCLVLAIGVGVSVARSMTRPLAALRLGAQRLAADPEHAEPLAFKGRDDEFAAAVRSVNALHARIGELARRVTEREDERARLLDGRRRLATEREALREERDALRAEVAELTERVAEARSSARERFVQLALRTLGLVERQLNVIEALEAREQDPERLDTLFTLDHLAARMRRNTENLLVLAGAETGPAHTGPVPLLDVLRAAVSEIEHYERVHIPSLPPHVRVAGFAADDVSHLVAELLENATAFSPPEARVELTGWLMENGALTLSVRDEGVGMTAGRLEEINARLDAGALGEASADDSSVVASELPGAFADVGEGMGLGLHMVVRLAARHGVRVRLRGQEQGGVTAVVLLPNTLLSAGGPEAPTGRHAAPGAGVGAGSPSLPGSVAEANSNALQARVPRPEGAAVGDTASAPTAAAPSAVVRSAAAPSAVVRSASSGADAVSGADDVSAVQVSSGADVASGVRASSGADPAPGAQGSSGADAVSGVHASSEASVSYEAAAQDRPEGAPAPPESPAPAPQKPVAHPAPAAEGPRLTGAGLPKRVPKVVARRPPAMPRRGGVDAEALRRKLGGFQRGAREGRRDVEAELAGRTAPAPRTETGGAAAPGESHVVEEARE
ncbi:nitrate- and nitrite sensing domain-containing protein [Streptomyces sp. NPDC003077]|uniref:nitrate- and nitrite sensing domain-containing protein n=1 Tax=Streptomyces sp. NPDC003077 TaxID=3154443 RepID=UPI0033B7BB26